MAVYNARRDLLVDESAELVRRARTGRAMNALDEAAALFEDAGIVLPPIPARLAPGVRRVEKWCYASRKVDPFAMYEFAKYLSEAVTQPVEDYVAVSHAGHGANSYGLNYHLVYGRIALFVQVGWGGAYDDGSESARIAAWFATCGEIVDAVDRLETPPLGNLAKLIVAQSDFRDISICRSLEAPLAATQANDWLDESELGGLAALEKAVDFLNEH